MSVSTRKWIILVLAAIMTVSSVILLNFRPAVQRGLPEYIAAAINDDPVESTGINAETINRNDLQITFSHPGHFYDSDIDISISASVPGAAIYYTMDGSVPTIYSTLYSEPIFIKAYGKNEHIAVTIRAITAVGDVISRPFAHTYFVGTDVHDRFDTMIFVLSTNFEDLYDYDTGIFVEGRTRSEFIENNPGEPIIPPSPANFNWRGMEGERPVYVEVFKPNGERVISQAAGIRAHGAWSRAIDQKSIRLIARSMYEDGQGKFHFDFFPEDTIRDGFESPLGKYDQLVLRNGANDRDFAMLRNEVGLRLARMAGLEVASPARPVSVFLNGEYYGFAWAQVRINSQYLEDIFNAPARNFQIVGLGERWIDTDDPIDREDLEHLNSFYDKDLTNDEIFDEFEQLVDIDQLMRYYTLQTFLGNHDWPHNNLKRWRYMGPQEGMLAPELDGRWRYVAFDIEWILGLYEDPPNIFRPTFQQMMDPRNERFSHMLNALFARQDMVDKFAMYMCDIAANVVTGKNVSDIIDELFGAARNEINHALNANKYSHWVSMGTIRDNHSNMFLVANGRSEYIFHIMREYFGWEDSMFTVEVTGAEAYIGSQIGTSAKYFDHLTIPLKPVLSGYDVFDHWIINGLVINTQEITVSIEDTVDGVVRVELITREELPVLIFSEAYGSSERNGCVLYNPGDEAVYTDGMYITNSMENPFRWALPAARIEPGEKMEIAGRSSRATDDLHKIQMSFNARRGHILFLCDEDGVVITHTLVS